MRRDVQARMLVPIGGGYRHLSEFAREVVAAAPGPVVRVAVLPAACGIDRGDCAAMAELAESVALIRQACVRAAAAIPGLRRVEAVLVHAHQPGDGDRPECAAAVASHKTDGVFLLGGDQDRAMRIVAGSWLEEAIVAACADGAVVGGTSAGAAVQSVTMLAGFAGGADESTGLRRGSTDLWWGSEGRRGLAVGTGDCLIDQHVFQRGRLGRLLAATARCAEGERPVVGVGLDVRTGARVTRDRISGVFGDGAVALADLSAAEAWHGWAGPAGSLVARNILLHLFPPGPWSYDLKTRTAWHERVMIPFIPPPRLPLGQCWHWRGRLLLAGGLLGHPSPEVFGELVQYASGPGPMLVVLRAYAGTDQARAAAGAYVAALRQACWDGPIDVCYPADSLPADAVGTAAGVILAAGDEAILAAELASGPHVRRFAAALPAAPAVLLDDAMTAAAGAELAAVPRPRDDASRGELASATLRPEVARFSPGLGLVPAVTEPLLTTDHRWARLLVATSRFPERPAVGICQATALAIGAGRPAEVIGRLCVVAVDGRAGTYATGDNGVLGAVNLLLDCHSAGDPVDHG